MIDQKVNDEVIDFVAEVDRTALFPGLYIRYPRQRRISSAFRVLIDVLQGQDFPSP